MTYGFATDIWPSAPLAVLAFMGTLFLAGCALLAVIYFAIRRQPRNARHAFAVLLAVILLYGTCLLGFAWGSRENVLAFRQEKHFCEIDCHPAYSVDAVEKTKTLGAGANLQTARGIFYVVSLKARFDETTISSQRGMAPLHPNGRAVIVIDDQGKAFPPIVAGQHPLEAAGDTTQDSGNCLERTFSRPGDSYVCILVFDLPAGVRLPRLFLQNSEPENRLLIGHENTWFHKKTVFALEPGSA